MTISSEDQEANLFAIELLMPEKLLTKDCEGIIFNAFTDERIVQLAQRYAVTQQLMIIRLAQLGFFKKLKI